MHVFLRAPVSTRIFFGCGSFLCLKGKSRRNLVVFTFFKCSTSRSTSLKVSTLSLRGTLPHPLGMFVLAPYESVAKGDPRYRHNATKVAARSPVFCFLEGRKPRHRGVGADLVAQQRPPYCRADGHCASSTVRVRGRTTERMPFVWVVWVRDVGCSGSVTSCLSCCLLRS